MNRIYCTIAMVALATAALVVGCESDKRGLIKLVGNHRAAESCSKEIAKPVPGKLALVYTRINSSTDWYLAKVTGVYSGGAKVAADVLNYYEGGTHSNVVLSSDNVRPERTGCESVKSGSKVLATYYKGYETETTSGTVIAVFEGEKALVELDGNQTGSDKYVVVGIEKLALSDI